MSYSLQPYGLQLAKLLCPWNFQARILERVAISSSRDLPDPGIEPVSPESPVLQKDSLLLHCQGSPMCVCIYMLRVYIYMLHVYICYVCIYMLRVYI